MLPGPPQGLTKSLSLLAVVVLDELHPVGRCNLLVKRIAISRDAGDQCHQRRVGIVGIRTVATNTRRHHDRAGQDSGSFDQRSFLGGAVGSGSFTRAIKASRLTSRMTNRRYFP